MERNPGGGMWKGKGVLHMLKARTGQAPYKQRQARNRTTSTTAQLHTDHSILLLPSQEPFPQQ